MLESTAAATNASVLEEERATDVACVLHLVWDAEACVGADEVVDVVRLVEDGLGGFDVVDCVAAVVAACLEWLVNSVLGTLNALRKVAVVADVNDHSTILAHAAHRVVDVSAVDATHKVLDVALPLVAACSDALEVHVCDHLVAAVAVEVVVVLEGEEHLSMRVVLVVDGLSNGNLDVLGCLGHCWLVD